MKTTALLIGTFILTLLAAGLVLFALAVAWYAITEARKVAVTRRRRKRRLQKIEFETARDCADYLTRWGLPYDTTLGEIHQYFNYKDNDRTDENM